MNEWSPFYNGPKKREVKNNKEKIGKLYSQCTIVGWKMDRDKKRGRSCMKNGTISINGFKIKSI